MGSKRVPCSVAAPLLLLVSSNGFAFDINNDFRDPPKTAFASLALIWLCLFNFHSIDFFAKKVCPQIS
jgi:hypothetical protein